MGVSGLSLHGSATIALEIDSRLFAEYSQDIDALLYYKIRSKIWVMTRVKAHREIDTTAKIVADWRSMAIVHAIYEHGPVRYKDLINLLEFSPAVLSNKLVKLAEANLIIRKNISGRKEVFYEALPVAESMVQAYHLLETIDKSLKKEGDI